MDEAQNIFLESFSFLYAVVVGSKSEFLSTEVISSCKLNTNQLPVKVSHESLFIRWGGGGAFDLVCNHTMCYVPD